VPPTFAVNPQAAPQILAGPYLAARRDFGTPALTTAELAGAPASTQATADSTIEQAEAITAAPSPSAPCASTNAAAAQVRVPPGHRLTVSTGAQPARLYVRRFAASFPGAPLSTLSAHRTYTVRFPADEAPAVPWVVAAISTGHVSACVS
jgi:hypothetical protein